MEIKCPHCNQKYEVEKERSECQFECGNCLKTFYASGNIVYAGAERAKIKKSGCSPILIFGGIFFLAIILFFCFYGCGGKKQETKPRLSFKYGVSESYLSSQAWLMSQKIAKKHLKYPEEASFSWSPDQKYEFDYLGKYGVNISGYVTTKNAFGVRSKLKIYATWHYDPNTKQWECKSFSMD